MCLFVLTEYQKNEKYYLCDRFKIHIKWKAKNILKR